MWNNITILNIHFLFEYIVNVIYSCGGKAEFSADIIPVLQKSF